MRRIGIDVGGTNTDAVLLDGSHVLGAIKTATTEDVTAGIEGALADLLIATGAAPGDIEAVMIGTTHFTNAVVQRRGLSQIAAVRVCLPAAATLPPFCDWPEDLAAVVDGGHYLLAGGHEYDGRPIAPFDEVATKAAALNIAQSGVTAAAISAVFSPINEEFEAKASAILAKEAPSLPLSESRKLGRLGLLERENITLLNAALLGLARRTVAAFEAALANSGITAPLYLTQNDGTIVGASEAALQPVFSFASGPTNSMRGAAMLSGLENAIVVDVGGTTTDIGCLRNGFPREANNVIEIGGVRTNFRMPDVRSIGIGGGSLIQADPLAVGPVSTGYEISSRALIFGGSEITATDCAVAMGQVDIGDTKKTASMPAGLAKAASALISETISETVDRTKPDAAPLPLIAVGGGAFLVPDSIDGISQVVRVEHAGVANAIGAALAQVSGEVDRVQHGLTREAAMEVARNEAVGRATAAGADPETIRVVDMEDIPLSYLPGNALRTRVRVVGELRKPADH